MLINPKWLKETEKNNLTVFGGNRIGNVNKNENVFLL